MEFTFNEYKRILDALKKRHYRFTGYTDYEQYEKSVILRHDVDVSLRKALEMAEFEHSLGVVSTYFILITADFYNAFNKRNRERIQKIKELGMEIGLHFDETIYPLGCDIVSAVKDEIRVMQKMLGIGIRSVSMHVPSEKTLKANYEFGNCVGGVKQTIVNSYSNVFWNEFKYVSDSKRRWRENIYEVIASESYPRIHLLTHPIWYHTENISMWDTVSEELRVRAEEAYDDFEIHTSGVQGRKTVEECLKGTG